jgi:hypothetical protein
MAESAAEDDVDCDEDDEVEPCSHPSRNGLAVMCCADHKVEALKARGGVRTAPNRSHADGQMASRGGRANDVATSSCRTSGDNDSRSDVAMTTKSRADIARSATRTAKSRV